LHTPQKTNLKELNTAITNQRYITPENGQHQLRYSYETYAVSLTLTLSFITHLRLLAE